MCKLYNLCPVHVHPMVDRGGYDSDWYCAICGQENEAKRVHRNMSYEDQRLQAIAQLNAEWALPHKEFE